MRASPLTLSLAVLAAATVAATAVLVVSMGHRANPVLDRRDPIAAVAHTTPVELDLAPVADVQESARTEAPPIEPAAQSTTSAVTYTFDVTFVTIDELGRALPKVDVELGLDGHDLNGMGESGWNGDLHAIWTGTEPTLNAIVCARRSGKSEVRSRVQLRAGRPVVFRLVADQPSAAAWDALVSASSSIARIEPSFRSTGGSSRSSRTSHLSFETEQDGRGTFTDPELLRHVFVEGEAMPGEGWFTQKISCATGGTKLSSLPVFAHDESGAPLAGVPCLALNDWEPIEGVTDADGRFLISIRRTYSLVVYVGGRDRALVRTSVDMKDVPSVVDVTVPRVTMTTGRLVDGDGNPLSDWLVRAHDIDAFGDFIGSTVTDAEGEFALPLQKAGPVQLRVRPEADLSGPTCLASRRFPGSGAHSGNVVVSDSHTIGVVCHVDVPGDVMGGAPAIRLSRKDTHEAVELDPFEFEEVPGNLVRYGFRDDALLTGEYALEVLASGCEPSGRASMFLDEASTDMGVFTPRPRPRLRIDGADYGIVEGARAMLETKVQGVRVISSTMSLPGLFAVPEGEFGLYVGREAPRTGVAATMHPFHTVKGQVVSVEGAPASGERR